MSCDSVTPWFHAGLLGGGGGAHSLRAESVRVPADLAYLLLIAIYRRGHVRCSVDQGRHILCEGASAGRMGQAQAECQGSGQHAGGLFDERIAYSCETENESELQQAAACDQPGKVVRL